MIFGTICEESLGQSESPYQGQYDCQLCVSFLQHLILDGHFDEYYLFYTQKFHDEAVLSKYNFFQLIMADPRVKLASVSQIPQILRSREFTVFHNLHSASLQRLSYLRSRFAPVWFPVTGQSHASLCLPMMDIVSAFLLPEVYSFDSIICTNVSSKEAFQKMLTQASDAVRRYYGIELKYPGKCERIPLGVDTEVFCPRDKRAIRQLMGLPLEDLIVLCLINSSASEEIDLFPLLYAFKNVVLKNSNRKLFILLASVTGQYDHIEEIQTIIQGLEISNRVLFRTASSVHEPALLYSAADVFIAPVDSTGCSFEATILQAMSSGLPVLVSDWDGYKEIVAHGESGFRVPTYWTNCNNSCSLSPIQKRGQEQLILAQSICIDIGEISRYLSLVLENAELRGQMGHRARKQALTTHNWRSVICRYEELWRDLYNLARSHQQPSSGRASLLQMRPFHSFSSYATHIPTTSTQFEITQCGEDVLNARGAVPYYYTEMEDILLPHVVAGILTFLTKQSATMEEIINVLIQKHKSEQISHRDVIYQLTWMLKHGLIRINGYTCDGKQDVMYEHRSQIDDGEHKYKGLLE